MARKEYPRTPDGRYFVAKSRLWRCTNPNLPEERRRELVRDLMKARRAVRFAKDEEEERAARGAVHEAKVALGERGPVWWNDGAADVNERHPKNTDYADWWAGLTEAERKAGS